MIFSVPATAAPEVSAPLVTVVPPCAANLENPGEVPRSAIAIAYEMSVAEAYLRSRAGCGEKIRITSQIDKWDVPAFDGVILNAADQKIANLSIKGLRVSGEFALSSAQVVPKMTELIKKATRRITDWGEEPKWDSLFQYSRAELAQLLMRDPAHSLGERKILLDMVMDLFSIPLSKSGIRTRILLAITDMKGELENFDGSKIPSNAIRMWLARRGLYVESITILAKNKTWDFESGQ